MRKMFFMLALTLSWACGSGTETNEPIDTEDTEVVDTEDTTPECTDNAYQGCSGNSVYWFDSCDARGTIVDTCTSTETCTESGNTASCVENYVPTTLEGYYYCDGTQSYTDWWVAFALATTPSGRVQEVTVTLRQSSTTTGSWTIPYDSVDSGADIWAGGLWEDTAGINCDDTSNTHITAVTNDGATATLTQYIP